MRIIIALFVAALFLWTALWLMDEARAHSWYDTSCCSGRDCEAISIEAVTESATGWTVDYLSKQGFIVHGFTPRGKERDSQDGQFHGCAMPDRFLCLYVPRTV